jgi:deoxyadenosine/deoxycytidine kinase
MATSPCTVPFLVSMEGNLASGKTRILQSFEGHDMYTMPEPIEKWRWELGQNLLERKYNDPTGSEFMFQMLVNLTRLEDLAQTYELSKQVRLQERSFYSSHYVFTELAKSNLVLNGIEKKMLDKWFNVFTSGKLKELTTPDLIVYVRTTPNTCYERMRKRDRLEEANVSAGQIDKIHQQYESWLSGPEFRIPCPVYIFDGECEEEDLVSELIDLEMEIAMHRRRKEDKLKALANFGEEMNDDIFKNKCEPCGCALTEWEED